MVDLRRGIASASAPDATPRASTHPESHPGGRTFREIGWLAPVVLLLACDVPATTLVVLVDSDYPIPSELATVRAQILDDAGAEVSSYEFAVSEEDTPPTRFALPFSFAVIPAGGKPARNVTIEITAVDPTGTVLSSRRARTGFIAEQTLLLPMFLAKACASIACEPDETCTERGCQSVDIDPAGLRPVRPGDEVLDAGMSTAVDGEAGTDCTVAAPCACASSPCSIRCPSAEPCVVRCEPGTECTVDASQTSDGTVICEEGATCTVMARGDGQVVIRCEANSTCDVTCTTTAQQCEIDCTGAGATCRLTCLGTLMCGISGCPTAVNRCGPGSLMCGAENC
jgi:hypothetical protein